MKIVGYNASPRKMGSTAWTLSKILEESKKQGAETELWHSGELNISPCRGCLGCVQGDGCVIADDMQKLYAALQSADALVLGAPIYMGQMSAQAKIFTDRLFAQITPRFSPRFKEENAGKKLTLVFTQGNPDANRFQAYYDYTKNMFRLLEFDMQEMIVVTGTRSEPAHQQQELLPIVRAAGLALR